MFARFAEVLTADEIKGVHEVSLDVLEQVGILVRNEKARDRFRRNGCRVDADTQIVTFPRAVVEEFRRLVPPSFTFHARNPALSRTIPGDGLVVATASSAPNLIDPDTGEDRRSTSEDIARIGHLVTGLDGIDVFSVSVLANDAPEGQFSLSRFYPAVKNCWKPVRTSVVDLREARQIVELGAAVAGSEAAFRARPFITFGYCSIVDPLTMDFDSTEMLMHFAEEGLQAYGTIAPIGGISAPLRMMGMLAQINAEWLATAVLAQMSRPGTELIYNFLPVVGDMRSGAYAPGAIETGIMAAALVGMARFYDVPCGSYLGLTNSKLCDAQSGFEKAMSPTLAAAAGIDFVVMGGLIDQLMSFDFGQAVVDDEIALMLKRFRQQLRFGGLAGCLEEIRAAGPGGMYVDKAATLDLMKTCALLPTIADRERREVWLERGAQDAHARALAQAKSRLCQPNPARLTPEVDARVRARFGDALVPGETAIPDSWRAAQPIPARARRGRKTALAQ
ncbi:MAG: trimethylamine methyltransferase family protein [Alphaproteobacteria bacterium]|nr:trimethylamine methyltransferase family protein [Alphaproteobacteria bacterium]